MCPGLCIVLRLMHVHKRERRGERGEERRGEQNTSFRIGFPTCGIKCYLQLDCTKLTKKTLGPCLLLKKISCLLLEWNGENGSKAAFAWQAQYSKFDSQHCVLVHVCGKGTAVQEEWAHQSKLRAFYSIASCHLRIDSWCNLVISQTNTCGQQNAWSRLNLGQ